MRAHLGIVPGMLLFAAAAVPPTPAARMAAETEARGKSARAVGVETCDSRVIVQLQSAASQREEGEKGKQDVTGVRAG